MIYNMVKLNILFILLYIFDLLQERFNNCCLGIDGLFEVKEARQYERGDGLDDLSGDASTFGCAGAGGY